MFDTRVICQSVVRMRLRDAKLGTGYPDNLVLALFGTKKEIGSNIPSYKKGAIITALI